MIARTGVVLSGDRVVAFAEAVVMSSTEADVSDGKVEFNLVVKAPDTVIEVEPDGVVVQLQGWCCL